MPDSLIFFLIIPVLLQPIVILISFLRLMQLQYQYPTYSSLQPPNQVISEDLKQLLRPTLQQLKALGFQLCGSFQVNKLCYLECADDRSLLMYHAQTGCFAEVELRYPVDSLDLANVVFYSPFQDATWLITMNGQIHNVLGQVPNVLLEDAYQAKLTGQWEHHQTRLADLNRSPVQTTPKEFLLLLQALLQQYIDSLVIKRSLLPHNKPESRQIFYLSWQAGLGLALQIRNSGSNVSRRQTAIRQLHTANKTKPAEIPVSFQLASFRRMREMESNRRSLRLGKWILLVSLGLFMAMAIALPRSFGTLNLTDLYSLVAVLFIHEAGHFLAMKAFGYRDTTMFFLPMFGAAVTGKKENASLTEKVWVLLAGPLPGIILGLGLMMATRFYPNLAWLDHTALMMVGLNLLNLLPFYPLDGGKIANHLLFSRYPFTDVIFKAITVVLFGLMGLASSPMLVGLAIITAISIPNSYRTAKLNQTIQQHLQQNPHENPLELIFRQMAAAGYSSLPFLKRDAIAKELLERQRENKAPLASRLALAGIYSFSLLFGVGGMLGTLVVPSMANLSQTTPRAVQKKLQTELDQASKSIQSNPKAATNYVDRAEIYRAMAFAEVAQTSTQSSQRFAQIVSNQRPQPYQPNPQYLQKALSDYDRAIVLEPNLAETYRQRATLKQLIQQPKSAIADLSRLIKLQPQDPNGYFDRAQVYLDLKNYKAALADANQLIQLNPKDPAGYGLRGQIWQKIGDRTKAKADLKQAQRLANF